MTNSEIDAFVRWNNRTRDIRYFSAPNFNSPIEKFIAKWRCFVIGHKYKYNGETEAFVLGTSHDMYRYTCTCCGKEKLSFIYEG